MGIQPPFLAGVSAAANFPTTPHHPGVDLRRSIWTAGAVWARVWVGGQVWSAATKASLSLCAATEDSPLAQHDQHAGGVPEISRGLSASARYRPDNLPPTATSP